MNVFTFIKIRKWFYRKKCLKIPETYKIVLNILNFPKNTCPENFIQFSSNVRGNIIFRKKKNCKMRKKSISLEFQPFSEKYIEWRIKSISLIYFVHLFQKLFSFAPQVSFWQGFQEEVSSFKEQTKLLTHEELITLTEDLHQSMLCFNFSPFPKKNWYLF